MAFDGQTTLIWRLRLVLLVARDMFVVNTHVSSNFINHMLTDVPSSLASLIIIRTVALGIVVPIQQFLGPSVIPQ